MPLRTARGSAPEAAASSAASRRRCRNRPSRCGASAPLPSAHACRADRPAAGDGLMARNPSRAAAEPGRIRCSCLARSSVVSSRCLALVIVAPGLGAVAAALHRAPAPLAGAAVVEEQPAAFGVGAAPDPVEARAGQKVAGRPQHRRQQRQRRSRLRIDIPAIAAALAPERGARGRRRQRLVQRREVARGRRLVLGLGVEQPVEGLAQLDRPLEFAARRRLGRARPAIGGRPAREILRRVQRLGRLGLAAPDSAC